MAGKWTRWFGDRESRTVVSVCGKVLEVRCSAAAARALAARDSPLIVELELVFACFARKEIRFYESSGEVGTHGSPIPVNGTLALRILTIVPDACEAGAGKATSAPARNFVPRWVRIDHVKGRWVGEYGW